MSFDSSCHAVILVVVAARRQFVACLDAFQIMTTRSGS
jgi:hypothetical protein